MKIGLSPAFGFAHYGENINLEKILKLVSMGYEMGFCGFQLETYSKEQMDIYTDENINRIKEHYLKLGMESSQFIGHSLKNEINSIDNKKIDQGIEELKRLVEICKKLEIITVFNIPAAPCPKLIVDYYETYPGAVQPVIDFPKEISWQKIWDTYVNTISKCLDIISNADMKLAIEAVPYGIICSTDSFLRLLNNLDNNSSLGFMLDTGHIFVQKEPVQTAIYKLSKKIFGTHICDNDGCIDDHWMPPKGKIEWEKVLRAFNEVGYDGPLDIEVNVVENPNQAYKEGKKYLEKINEQLTISI
jgi:sugar phosphate isomerase/epimerase